VQDHVAEAELKVVFDEAVRRSGLVPFILIATLSVARDARTRCRR